MKVYDYLEFIVCDKITDNNCLELIIHLENTYGINSMKGFYNQPFAPELIIKFFKGWDLRYNDEKNYYELNDFEKNISVTSHHNKITYFKDKIWYESLLPIVLNDFIRDCIRAEIELEM